MAPCAGRSARAALAASLVTALSAALLTSYAAAQAAGSNRPAVGECRALRFGQISDRSDTSAPIACSSAHTDRVIKVADLPSR